MKIIDFFLSRIVISIFMINKKKQTLCLENNLKFHKNSINTKIINFQMLHAKNIFNSAIFFQRRWYDIIELHYNYYTLNIDQYLLYFTSSDCELLFKYSLRSNNIYCLKKLYQISNNKEQLLEMINDINLKQILIQLPLVQECTTGKKQNTCEMLNHFNSYNILLNNFPDFVSNIINTLEYKLENEIKTKNKKEDISDDEEDISDDEEDDDEDDDEDNDNINLIPPTYLGYNYMELYIQKFIPSYKLVSSQVAQQIILKVAQSYKSFFALREKGFFKAKPPNYNKTNKFNLIFQKDTFKIQQNKIRLSLGIPFKNQFNNNFNEVKLIGKNKYIESKSNTKYNQKLHGSHYPELEKRYLYVKFNSKCLKKKKIVEIEIVPSQYKNVDNYKLILKYKIDKPIIKQLDDNLQKMSIDLGMRNLATIFSPMLNTPIIYDGKCIIKENMWINYKIDKIKSKIKKELNLNTNSEIQQLLVKKAIFIKNYFHKISNNIIDNCKKLDIREIIIGYNVNWKKNVNMGKRNNRKFYEVPYLKFVNMLFYKGKINGIEVVENEESYTSKCDSLGQEEIKRHEVYMGKRISRGLFQSSQNVLLNSDVNGAINIMRKYINKKYDGLKELLNEYLSEIKCKNVCNPLKIGRRSIKYV